MIFFIPDGIDVVGTETKIKFGPGGWSRRKLRKPVEVREDGGLYRNNKRVGKWLKVIDFNPKLIVDPTKLAEPSEIERVRWRVLTAITDRIWPRRQKIMEWLGKLAPKKYKNNVERYISLLKKDHSDKPALDQLAHVVTEEEADALDAYDEVSEQLRRYCGYAAIAGELLSRSIEPWMPRPDYDRHRQETIAHLVINGRDYLFIEGRFASPSEAHFWPHPGNERPIYRRVEL